MTVLIPYEFSFSSFDIQPIVQTSDASVPPESPESQEETSEDESEVTDNRYITF